jgi:hydroxymethylpyrimidine/phosphomethylpyrimidine kinase
MKTRALATRLLSNRNTRRSDASRDPRLISVLTIAGSDSGGGAGIQADLKTFAAFGVHGLSAITAVTAQNTRAVRSVHLVPAAAVTAQLEAVAEDFRLGAVKIGMLGSAPIVAAVVRFLRQRPHLPVVLDPVLISSSGTPLLAPRARAQLRDDLIPLATVFTPNLPEAEILLDRRDILSADARALARDLLALGAQAVLLKGGHGNEDPVRDYLADAGCTRAFRHARLPVIAHGTGCVLAAAIAAGLALGSTPAEAVRAAERHLQNALRASYQAGNSAVHILLTESRHK